MALAVEKTGYPRDMLDLDLDLEADLGVDTVKQAEMFAAIREIYNIPRDENRKLRDYPTLAHVIRFVYEKRPDLASAAPPSAAPKAKEEVKVATSAPVVSAAGGDGGDVKERILTLAVEKTGYPRDMLDLDLDLEADLGVDTVKQAEMFAAIREIYGIPRDENRKLRDYPTLAHVIRFVDEKCPDLASAAAPLAAPKAKEEVKVDTSAPAASPAGGAGGDDVKERILTLAVEKTGYPRDMLDLDLDLEADLGVDTVKQAEMFAAIREIYGIPRDENRKLRDYPTLAHVIRFVYEKRPDLASAAAPVAAPKAKEEVKVATSIPAASPAGGAGGDVRERILTLAVEKTGYPRDMLDLDLDLEADLGVDTVKQAEMFAAIREIYSIPRDENRKLRDYPTLAHVIRFVYEKRPDLAAPAATPRRRPASRLRPNQPPLQLKRPRTMLLETKCWRLWPRRLAIQKTCWTWIWISKPISASIPSSRRRCSPPSERRITYRAIENLKLRDFPTLGPRDQVRARPSGFSGSSSLRRRTGNDEQGTEVLQFHLSAATPPMSRAPCSPVSTPRIAFHAACRCPSCARHSPSASRRASHSTAAAAWSSCPTKVGWQTRWRKRCKTKGVEVLRIEGAPDADALTGRLKKWMTSGSSAGSVLAARARQRRKPERDGSGHLARSRARTPQIALHNHARSVSSRSRSRARSWSRRRDSADSTATTKPERSLRSAAP